MFGLLPWILGAVVRGVRTLEVSPLEDLVCTSHLFWSFVGVLNIEPSLSEGSGLSADSASNIQGVLMKPDLLSGTKH